MSAHTPTPWVAGDNELGVYPIWAKCGPLDVQPAKAYGPDDAAFIVKAVNSHDHLVKALEASCGYLLNAKIDLETGATKATAIRTIEGGLLRAKAVLAIIEESTP
jgi:hypothetical protein